MALVYNPNVKETLIYSAYGLTVYGKSNRYIWTFLDESEENALISIRITDCNGEELFSMELGNRVILQCRIDDTLDNFLYWITSEHPDTLQIQTQLYKSLCASDSLFNHLMLQRKLRAAGA